MLEQPDQYWINKYSAGPPRCIGCAYVLRGLPSPSVCPECARPFDLDDALTYTKYRPFIGWRYWLTGFAPAAFIGVIVLLLSVFGIGSWGFSVWIGVPVAMGFLSGYFVRPSAYWLWYLVGFGAILAVTLVLGQLAGAFCILVLGAFTLVPLLVGMGAGHIVRHVLKSRGFALRKPLVIFLVFSASIAAAIVDRLTTTPEPLRTVSTSVEINQPIDLVWASVQFYEDVRHEPPLLLRIGLVRPISTSGASSRPGDIKTCVYNKGRLVKKTTSVRAPERLDFDVIEQHLGYERDVRLRSGSFVLTPTDDHTTTVTLTTTYEPLLKPRFIWAWGESWAIHTLHGHVLEGMRLDAERLGAASSASLTETQP